MGKGVERVMKDWRTLPNRLRTFQSGPTDRNRSIELNKSLSVLDV
jgi:hypothetical protein